MYMYILASISINEGIVMSVSVLKALGCNTTETTPES